MEKCPVVADRDARPARLRSFLGIDGETLDEFVDLGTALLELRHFGGEFVGPVLTVDVFKFGETLLDTFDFGGELVRNLRRARPNAIVLMQHPVFGLENGLRSGPLRAQFFGFRFEFLHRQPAHEGRIVEEAVIVAAEKIARDRAAGGLVGFSADELAEI